MLIYTEPQYHGKRPGDHGYVHYTREVYCTCGKKLGTQTKYDGQNSFSFDELHGNIYMRNAVTGKE